MNALTRNIALLIDADNAQSAAIDPVLAAEELRHALNGSTGAPPRVSQIAAGSRVLIAPSPSRRDALLEAEVSALSPLDAAAERAPVYSLELDTPGELSVYVVNRMLAMD